MQRSAIKADAIDASFVEKYIERIEVEKKSENEIHLMVYLKTGKYLENLALSARKTPNFRTGQMSKKMIEKYENEAQNRG